jgi:hypothetical protein
VIGERVTTTRGSTEVMTMRSLRAMRSMTTACFDPKARAVQIALAVLAAAILLAAALATASAQGRIVQVNGRVLWIMGQKMVVSPPSAGVPVNVDLTQLDQTQYASLTPGTLVDVTGVVSYDGRRMIATSVSAQPVPEEQATVRPPSKW